MASESALPIVETREQLDELLKNLPRAALDELPDDECCPICLNSFSSILDSGDSASVARLKCGHVFCLDDISEWVYTLNGSCPTCRSVFLVVPEPADDESSDGGEYILGSDSMLDGMTDTETWTDDEMWTDAEDIPLDTESETVWEGSSQAGGEDMHEEEAPTLEQVLESRAIDVELNLVISQNATCGDDGCEQIMNELHYWRTRIAQITVQDWVFKKDETRLLIHQGFSALRAINPRIEAKSSDNSDSPLSLGHSIMTTVQELHAEMQAKLDMIHEIDHYTATQQS